MAALLLSGANTNSKDSHVRLPSKVANQACLPDFVQPCLHAKGLGRALVISDLLSAAIHLAVWQPINTSNVVF